VIVRTRSASSIRMSCIAENLPTGALRDDATPT